MVCVLRADNISPRVCGIRTILILLWICASLLAGQEAFAQNAGIEKRGLILAMNRPLDSEAEQLFKGVVAQSVRWSLERQRLAVIETQAPSYEVKTFHNPTEMLDNSLTGEVDFILLTEYASRGRNLEIRMAWYDPQTGKKTEEVIRRGPKDLVLDKIIREALNELLSAVESSIDSLEPREFLPIIDSAVAGNADIKQSGTGSATKAANGAAAKGTAANGPMANGARVQPYRPGKDGELPSPIDPDLEPNQPSAESAPERKRHFDLAVGCAPFVATGAASEYFKIGVMPVLNLSYLFQGKLSRFGLGLYGGLNYFTATGTLASAETFLIPMGVSLRYEIGSERYPSVIFGICSGPALLMMYASTNETLLGLTFFGRGTLGVRLPIGRTFALLIEAGYDLYWEQPRPIMGFSPSVMTTIRL